ncbi:uncharacterized protein BROUX77_005245 [Berkeleyomyces rouxiae]|uniref:uncharacterized protein n=1 Tax=Berkeleyomyces rouxiae TaxID=2035830 RepID=UPI003B7B44D6
MYFSRLAFLAWATLSHAGHFENTLSHYSFDLNEAFYPKWMASIPDDVQVSSLSIPGTHSSMSSVLVKNIQVQCQNLPLIHQLHSGIRYIDVVGRLHKTDTTDHDLILIFHRGYYTEYSLDSILLYAFDFLDENPSEGLIMRFQKDTWFSGSNKAFEDAVKGYLASNSESGQRAKNRLYIPTRADGFSPPTMGQLRGKLMILQDFPTKTPGRFGIPWGSSALSVSNWKYVFGDPGKAIKWRFVQSGIQSAATEEENKLHLTHASTTFGAVPYKVAGGKTRQEKGMNDRLGDYLNEMAPRRTGIVVMDFPGKHLVGSIIKLNAPLYSSTEE